jgi:hypothetical protein
MRYEDFLTTAGRELSDALSSLDDVAFAEASIHDCLEVLSGVLGPGFGVTELQNANDATVRALSARIAEWFEVDVVVPEPLVRRVLERIVWHYSE